MMQMGQNISAEEMARLFHQYREMLASDYGFQGSEGAVAWEQVLPNHRHLMVATARLVLHALAAKQHGRTA